MIEFSAHAHELLGSDAVAHVWTNNPDGTPQVSVVWMIARGDQILFGTDANSQKARNLARDDRIVLSIEDVERNERGYQRHLIVRGSALGLADDLEELPRGDPDEAGHQCHASVLDYRL